LDKGLSRLKRAMDSDQNPLSMAEIDFVQTSCRILGIDSAEMISGRKALEKGGGQVRKVMTAINAQLDALGTRVEARRRATPTPALSTRTYDDMDAPGRSLAHLQVCAKSLRDAMVGGFSIGIRMAKIALENTLEDFKVTVARTGEAARWKHGVANEWYVKGKEVCGVCWRNLWEPSVKQKRGRGPKQGSGRLRESHCEELESLADQVEKQAASEMEPEPLIELEEEMEYEKDNVVSLAQTLKDTIPVEFKERAQRAVQESAKIAKEGRHKLGDLRARLEFCSFDSEAGSYRGPTVSAMEVAP
jgi:hypothetical protein